MTDAELIASTEFLAQKIPELQSKFHAERQELRKRKREARTKAA